MYMVCIYIYNNNTNNNNTSNNIYIYIRPAFIVAWIHTNQPKSYSIPTSIGSSKFHFYSMDLSLSLYIIHIH